jgi:hypothetical protein
MHASHSREREWVNVLSSSCSRRGHFRPVRSGSLRRAAACAERFESRRLLAAAIFNSIPSYDAGTDAQSLAAADFNHDGAIDVAVANGNDGTVTILKGNAQGAFSSLSQFSFNSGYANTIIAADLDRDGDIDFAVSRDHIFGYLESLSLLLNDGSGNFTLGPSYDVGAAEPPALIAADLNGDNNSDLVLADSYAGVISVFLNSGGASFVRTDYTTDQYPSSVCAADFNGDGKTDLAVACGAAAAGAVDVFLNAGNGVFAARVKYIGGSYLDLISAADVDGNGRVDLIAAGLGVGVLLNQGNGTFGAPANLTIPDTPNSLITTDLDGNGTNDIAVSSESSWTLSVFNNLGSATFAPRIDYAIDRVNQAIAADLNADARPDLLLASVNLDSSNNAGKVSVLMNKGDGTFPADRSYVAGSGSDAGSDLAAADFDGDGRIDLATANGTERSISVLFNTGEGPSRLRSNIL